MEWSISKPVGREWELLYIYTDGVGMSEGDVDGDGSLKQKMLTNCNAPTTFTYVRTCKSAALPTESEFAC